MILCVGGTPAVQRTLRFPRLELGEVNRASEVLVTASGKAVNAARVVTLLGGEAVVVTFLGGDPGRFVDHALAAEGVAREVIWTGEDAPTRTCVTLLPDGRPATELVEEAPGVAPKDVAGLEAVVEERLGAARALCLIGSNPPGVPDDLYARLAAAAADAGVPALVDAQGAPLRAALAARPFLVKPNLEEAAAALGLGTRDDPVAGAGAAVDALLARGARWALVSMGAPGSVLGDAVGGGHWHVRPPAIEARNPIGSGDSLAAGLLLAMTRGASVPEAAAYGTACAAANALSPTSGVVEPDVVAELRPRVTFTPLPARA